MRLSLGLVISFSSPTMFVSPGTAPDQRENVGNSAGIAVNGRANQTLTMKSENFMPSSEPCFIQRVHRNSFQRPFIRMMRCDEREQTAQRHCAVQREPGIPFRIV